MSENMEKFRHLDGNPAVIENEFVKITFQHGDPAVEGINGCRIEDLIDIVVEKLLDFQGRDLACEENATALYHLDLAREALLLRRRRRENQGLIGQRAKHSPD
jgi:hypothetical protein